MGALASFYNKIPVCHVEAGLRTQDLFLPFPEEGNRRLISVVSRFHFTPTQLATQTLIEEGYSKESVLLTGNTGIDALLLMTQLISNKEVKIPSQIEKIIGLENLVLVTCHRRETFGAPLVEVCQAIAQLADTRTDLNFVFPLHPNPNVLKIVESALGGRTNIHLTPALPYSQLVSILENARVIITDSGGIQEEGPTLGKRTIVLRTLTERSEAVQQGMAIMVGTNKEKIIEAILSELSKSDKNVNPRTTLFGDGYASERIIKIIEENFV
jgi:UDP-N-acetylglucosamine 2-epimerase (non-hydrolysing)